METTLEEVESHRKNLQGSRRKDLKNQPCVNESVILYLSPELEKELHDSGKLEIVVS